MTRDNIVNNICRAAPFLPRDAMHKRGLCRHAVSVRLSVRPSVRLSCSWIMSKRINISSNFFHHRVWHGKTRMVWIHHSSFGLIAGYRRFQDVRSAKNIYRRRSWVYDTAGHVPVAIDRLLDVRTTKWQKQLQIAQWATHHRMFVCDGLQHGRIRRREENRKEFNCTQWYIWSRNN